MSDPENPFSFSSFFAAGHYETQAETLEISHRKKKLFIGIPKEELLEENRVSLVPNTIRVITGYGHKVVVETGAGKNARFTDHNFSESGAEISYNKEDVFKADIIIKVQPPTLEEIDLMHAGQILLSPLSLPLINEEYLLKLCEKKVIALAMEYLQTSDGSSPIVRIMSEIAGRSAIMTASELLSSGSESGRGVLLGGVAGVPPSKIVILGAGIVGEFATKTALGLGASVRIFDRDVYSLMRIQNRVGRQLHTSALNPVYLAYQLLSADVVIGAIHSKTGRSPIIITEEMVSKMKPGSVIIDLSIDQGGCVETSSVTTLNKPTFVKHGVIHYCVPNITSKVPRTASVAISNIILPLVLQIGKSLNIYELFYDYPGLRFGVYTFKGKVTNEYLSKRFNLKYTNLDLILASRI